MRLPLRIAGIGLVAIAAAPVITPTQPAWADARTDFETLCTACHGFGIAGAPVIGDALDWAARLEKGLEQLYTNAIRGYVGEKGVMPPKGGFSHLSDQRVREIVDYMIEKSAVHNNQAESGSAKTDDSDSQETGHGEINGSPPRQGSVASGS